MRVETCIFGEQQCAYEQRWNIAQCDEVGRCERDVDGAVRPQSFIGAENEIAAQPRDRRRHLARWPELNLLAYRERGRVRKPTAYTQVDCGRAKITAASGRHSQAFGHRES